MKRELDMYSKQFAKLSSLFLVLFLVGCVTTTPQSDMTPLEIQSMQSREYEEPADVVFPSVVSVFQDLGYTIESADRASGFINARSAADSSMASKILLGVTSVNQTKATGFIETIGEITKVRLNFVDATETSSGWGQQDRTETPILEPQAYQNAFERIENAIFVRSVN
jgi:hypothetical protein